MTTRTGYIKFSVTKRRHIAVMISYVHRGYTQAPAFPHPIGAVKQSMAIKPLSLTFRPATGRLKKALNFTFVNQCEENERKRSIPKRETG